MVVKLQRPLASNAEDMEVLIYDESRNFETMVPWSNFWESMFSVFGLKEYGEAKFFAEAHLKGTELVIDRPFTKDLGW